jgi:serine/threonine-protein kinase
MSPEQALGQASSARSDIFSLGSVLSHLLLGRPWFDAPSLPKIVDRVLHDDPPRVSGLRPDLPAPLDAVLAMALAKREGDRYASAAHMAEDLEDLLAGKTARHAARDVAPPPGRASVEEGLLAGLTTAAGGPRGLPANDPLASLLDESPIPPAASRPVGPAVAPAAQTALAPTPVATGSRRRWLVPGGALGLAVLAAGALVSWRRSSVREPARLPSSPVASAEAPAAVTQTTPKPPAPMARPTTVPRAPTTAPAAAPPAVPVVEPTAQPGAPNPIVEAPPMIAPEAGEPAAEPTSTSDAARSRMRLSVEHPFENGRLIVWIDGVLVYETKLSAPVSRKIVAFKLREGRAETLLDVAPGPHEVRVEVTWDQGRRASTKVIDVARGSTGLLEARVGRMTKDLNLSWSRLATN